MLAPATTAPPSGLPDADVIARVLAGETALFEVLMRRHNAKVWRAVRAVLRDGAEAEDAMQQAWLAAYAHLGEFAGASALGTWLVRIALNAARSRIRGRAPLGPVPDTEADMTDETPAPESAGPERRAAAREALSMLEAAVDGLSPALREVYVLREAEGLSTAEVADALGVDEGAVKVRLHRARAAVRARVEAELGGAAAELFGFLGARCDRMVARVLAALGARQGPGPGGGAA